MSMMMTVEVLNGNSRLIDVYFGVNQNPAGQLDKIAAGAGIKKRGCLGIFCIVPNQKYLYSRLFVSMQHR